MKMNVKVIMNIAIATLLVLSMGGCSSNIGLDENPQGSGESKRAEGTSLSGKITIDGSSTVYPISAAVAEEFNKVQPDVEVTVALAGTGGGMKKLVAGEIDICNASRKIKDKEIEEAKKNGIEYTEFMIAYDGISVVVNKNNDWVSDITTEELNKIWDEKSTVKTWKDVNDKWPNETIKLYGPGTDSGTFEYFTEEVNKKSKSMRKDFTPSEDDNVLVKGIEGDKNSLGYFGFAYYMENKDKLKALKVNGVEPGFDTIKNGTYKPLSRPLFIYVNNKSMINEQVKEFVKYFLTEGTKVVKSVGYVELDNEKYKLEYAKIK
jgi:phosphate transport system substrate-binding protein